MPKKVKDFSFSDGEQFRDSTLLIVLMNIYCFPPQTTFTKEFSVTLMRLVNLFDVAAAVIICPTDGCS